MLRLVVEITAIFIFRQSEPKFLVMKFWIMIIDVLMAHYQINLTWVNIIVVSLAILGTKQAYVKALLHTEIQTSYVFQTKGER